MARVSSPPVIIDAWTQHPTLRFISDPMFDSLRRWTGQDTPTEEIPISASVTAMDDAGVTTSILTAWHGPQGEVISNGEVAEWVSEHPARFAGVASVDLRRPMKAVLELRRCVEQHGFVGLRMLPWLWELPPNDRRYYPLYAECVALDVPFCLQVGHTGPLRGSEVGRPIPYLDDVALDFPELRIVAGHIGYPWTEEMISLTRKYENVYIDTSAYTIKRFPPELVSYLKADGTKKVMFGSNFPMIAPGKALAALDSLGLDDVAQRRFLSGNAADVFRLDPQA